MSKIKHKITKSFVDSLPLSEDKQVIYRDSELTGFGLRVKGVKSFIAEKKLPNGTPCRVTIGRYGVWTVAQARDKAREYLLLISNGINPNEEKQKFKSDAVKSLEKDKSTPTLEDVYNRYIREKRLSKNSIGSYSICVNDYFADWKSLKLVDITQKMTRERFVILTDRSPAQANLAMKLLRALFNFAISSYLTADDAQIITIDNPVAWIGSKKNQNKVKRRRTYIRADQIQHWAHSVVNTTWLGEQNNDYRAYTNQDFLLLISLTGFRRSEAETVEWKNIDLKFGTITIKDTKNGEDLTLPLGNSLWKLLQERKKLAINEYVFPNRNGIGHISDRRNAREKVTEKSGIEFTFHDLRRTFVTIANSLAIGSYTIKRLLNHTVEDNDNDVTDAYIQVSFADIRKAMNMIEDIVLSDEVKKNIQNR